MGSFDSTMLSNLSVGSPIVLIKTLSGKQRVDRRSVIGENAP